MIIRLNIIHQNFTLRLVIAPRQGAAMRMN